MQMTWRMGLEDLSSMPGDILEPLSFRRTA